MYILIMFLIESSISNLDIKSYYGGLIKIYEFPLSYTECQAALSANIDHSFPLENDHPMTFIINKVNESMDSGIRWS